MMSDLNCFSFTGRLVKDAFFRKLASDKSILSFSVAINTGYGDNKKVLFVKVQQWGERGANIAEYLKQGTLISASGYVSKDEWKDNAGAIKTDIVVTVSSINLLSSKKENESKPEPEESLEDLNNLIF